MQTFLILVGVVAALDEEDGGTPEGDVAVDAGPTESRFARALFDGGMVEFFPDGGAGVGRPAWLHISGNRVLPDEAYRRELALPDDAVPDEATAVWVEKTLQKFLQETGYELASVQTHLGDGRIDVFVDEGRIEKIVTRGRFTYQTLRFRLALFIDQDVFNRPAMERQVQRLSKEIGINVIRWALVPTPNPDHVGPQIGRAPEIANIEGYELFHERRPYELHFFFEEHDWDTGFAFDIRSGYLDGLELIAAYHGAELFAHGDRWRVAASGGAGLRNRIAPETGFYPAFSRAFAEGRYWAPKLSGRVRPYAWVTGTLIGRARADLGLNNYNEASAIASIHLSVDLLSGLKASVGFGAQWRRIFNLESTPTADPALIPPVSERLRTFVELRAEWLFDADNERWDRMHRLDLGARYYFGQAVGMESGTRQYGWIFERYQRSIAFGWHDLIIKSRGRAAFGDVQFHDEENLGEMLRGVFGDTYIRKVLSLSAEFHFSLVRELFKVSLFADSAVWGQVDRTVTPNKESPRFGVAFGPGLHFLIQGIFQLDIYASFGMQPNGKNGIAGLMILNKVF